MTRCTGFVWCSVMKSSIVLCLVLFQGACTDAAWVENQGSTDTARRPSADHIESARRVCAEAERQLADIEGGNDIDIIRCEAQSDGESNIGLVFVLNDYVEWATLIATRPTDEVVFTVPLGLVVYSFGRSGEPPSTFDGILIVFDDADRTVYYMRPSDIDDVLGARTTVEAEVALRRLRDTMQITSLSEGTN